MATYRITAPNGQVFNVTAPDDAPEEEVLARVRTESEKPSAPPSSPTRSDLGTMLNPVEVARGPVGRFAAPAIGAGIGAVKGATVGAAVGGPLAWLTAPLGGVVGAGVGAMGGAAVPEAADLLSRVTSGQAPRPTGEVVKNVLSAGLAGAEGQVIGGAIGAAVTGLPGAASTARQQISRVADNYGINLSAAQQTGSYLFRAAEGFLKRTLGSADIFEKFGGRQAQQIEGALEGLGARLTGGKGMLDQATRANRFMVALGERVAAAKRYESRLFDKYIAKAGGPSDPVDVSALVPEARALAQDATGPLRRVSERIQSFGLREFSSTRVRVSGGGVETKIGVSGLPEAVPLPTTGSIAGTKTFQAPGIQVGSGLSPVPPSARLSELRQLRTELGEIAYPGKAAVVQETDIAAARRLYGAMTKVLEEHAASKGPEAVAALQEANQFARTVIHGTLDGRWYSEILRNTKDLGSFSSRLFNPRDTGMLRDAKAVLNREGWRMIQQQYIDDVLFKAGKPGTFEGATPIFDGRAFANRVLRGGEDNVLKVLFDSDAVKAVKDFASVASAAMPTTSIRSREFTTALVSIGSFGYGGITGVVATAAASFGLGKLLTNPTATRIISQALSSGSDMRAATGAAIRELVRSGVIAHGGVTADAGRAVGEPTE